MKILGKVLFGIAIGVLYVIAIGFIVCDALRSKKKFDIEHDYDESCY